MIYKGIRLVNGALIAAGIDYPYSHQELLSKEFLELHMPIEFVPFKFADPDTGQIIETISMAPYVPVTRDSSIMVRTTNILAITNLHVAAERRYLDFIEQLARRAQQGIPDIEEAYDDESNIPDDVLDLFDELDMTKVQ